MPAAAAAAASNSAPQEKRLRSFAGHGRKRGCRGRLRWSVCRGLSMGGGKREVCVRLAGGGTLQGERRGPPLRGPRVVPFPTPSSPALALRGTAKQGSRADKPGLSLPHIARNHFSCFCAVGIGSGWCSTQPAWKLVPARGSVGS